MKFLRNTVYETLIGQIEDGNQRIQDLERQLQERSEVESNLRETLAEKGRDFQALWEAWERTKAENVRTTQVLTDLGDRLCQAFQKPGEEQISLACIGYEDLIFRTITKTAEKIKALEEQVDAQIRSLWDLQDTLRHRQSELQAVRSTFNCLVLGMKQALVQAIETKNRIEGNHGGDDDISF